MINREFYRDVEQKNYFLTNEQIEFVFGDKGYLFNVQLEILFEELIIEEFQYRNISLITTCEDSSDIISFYKECSQIKLNLDKIGIE